MEGPMLVSKTFFIVSNGSRQVDGASRSHWMQENVKVITC